MASALKTLTRFWRQKESPWRTVDGAELKEALLEDDDNAPRTTRDPKTTKKWWLLTLFNILLFGGAVAFYIASWSKFSGRNACLKATSIYSPVFDEIDISMTETLLNGSLWLGDNPSVWRGLPNSAETNAAWDSFEHVKPIALTRAQIIAMGKDPSIVAKFNDDYWHLGDDAYVGALDMFHQIHCLNMLRLEAFRYWDQAGERVLEWTEVHWIHLQHCTDMLMQHMLCNADAGFLTYNWMEQNLHPYPDMSVRKQCRDWRQLVDYRDSHGVNITAYINWEKPEGVVELKQPREWWEHRTEHDVSHQHEG
ncbi:hypothetical protein F4775DRAFT_603564 [Biscogniauxia sp. FL1348]|nr:hypothetical protein F4775DRAFT_603564 [Biscogniauxia sp. FL1348]